MKPVRLLCYMFLWTWRCTTFNSIPSILILLTTKHVPLIYCVTFHQQKTKDCAPSGSFQHNLQHRCFHFWCLLSFITRRDAGTNPLVIIFFCISNLINKVQSYAIENNDKKSARRTSALFFLAWRSTSSAYSLYRNLSKFKRVQVPPNWWKHKNNSLKHWKKVKTKQ